MPATSDHLLPQAGFYGVPGHRRQAGCYTLGHWEPDPTLSVGLHTHEDAHLVLPLCGPYRSSAAGAPEHADRSVVIYNPPGTSHRDRFDATDGIVSGSFFTLSIPADEIGRAQSAGALPDHAVALRGPRVRALIHRLSAECFAWGSGSTLIVEGLCLELLGALARGGRLPAAPPPWLNEARARLEDPAPITVEAVAAAAGVHPVYLARQFRRHFEISPGELHLEARIARACALLEQARMPLSEVAYRTGFADQSHFTRAFARRRRITPGRYRTLTGR